MMHDATDLVDPLTGILSWVRPLAADPVAPRSLHTWVSHTSDVYRLFGWPADRYGTGMAFDDPQRAHGGAVGEAVERYCGNHIPSGLLRGSHRSLIEAGRRAVDPRSLMLYSEAQHADPGFPFVAFTPDLEVQWAPGVSLRDGSSVLVPASLVWVNYFLPPLDDEPPTNFAVFAGIAAGVSHRAAVTSALEELIERDATMVWWHSGGEPVGIDIDVTSVAARVQVPDGGPVPPGAVDVSYVLIPNRLGVPVVGALLRDHSEGFITLGVAARPAAAAAIEKAAAEAWSLRTYAAGLADRSGLIWRAADAGLIDGTPLKPYCADRRYADDYRDDFRDVTDLSCQAQIYLDPRMSRWCDRIAAPSRRVALSAIAAVEGDPHDRYLSLLHCADVEPVAVDLTTSDVAACGLHVARVVAPGLYSNPPAGFPFLGGHRLRTEPVSIGLRDRPLDEAELVLAPLPHT